MGTARPVRVAVANDYAIVVAGLAAVLEPFAERVTVVELAAGTAPISDVDVVLYDTFGQVRGGSLAVRDIVDDGTRLLVFGWDDDYAVVESTLDAGAAGYVSKTATGPQLVEAIERVHAGERVVPHGHQNAGTPAAELGRWPGEEHGLSPRESEVLALICQGYSNVEITERAFIGINTVKTHVRSVYRKLGVNSRTQAVVWGLQHGFEPDRTRVLEP